MLPHAGEKVHAGIEGDTDRQTDRQRNKQTIGLTKRQTDRLIKRLTEGEAEERTGKQIEDRFTDERQMNEWTDKRMDR